MVEEDGFCFQDGFNPVDKLLRNLSAQSIIPPFHLPKCTYIYPSLQLARRLSPINAFHHQLAKLARVLHIVKQAIDCPEVEALHRARDHRLDLLLADEIDHIGEFLAGAHGGAADFDVAQNSRHDEVHARRYRHAVDGDDAAGLKGRVSI